MVQPLGAALFHQHEADTLQQLNGSVHSLGQEEICARIFFIKPGLAGKKNGRSAGGNFLDLVHQLGAVQAGHLQVTQDQINAALLKGFQGLVAIAASQHAVAARFQHQFSNGERLLIIVHAQDRSFRSHLSFPPGIFRSWPAQKR